MTLATARADLIKVLAASLGKSWAVFPSVAVDDPTKPTLVLERSRVEKLPAAPQGVRLNTFLLVLVSPQGASEDALDEWLETLLAALDKDRDYSWSAADRSIYAEAYAAYQITLTHHSIRKA